MKIKVQVELEVDCDEWDGRFSKEEQIARIERSIIRQGPDAEFEDMLDSFQDPTTSLIIICTKFVVLP